MKEINSFEELVDDLISSNITMVWKELFIVPMNNKSNLDLLEGDVVECGVWRGGYSIFLSHLFPEKNIWVCDSFEGFQPLKNAKYNFEGERHTPEFTHGSKGPIAISLEEVKENFKIYGLENQDRIKFLKGFVKDSLPTSGIEKISLLRLDVDSYSATLEILDELYNKVVPGGLVIFDDANLKESYEAIKIFMINNNIPLQLIHPYTNELYSLDKPICDSNSGFLAGSYIIK